jgi:hypothetical protein
MCSYPEDDDLIFIFGLSRGACAAIGLHQACQDDIPEIVEAQFPTGQTARSGPRPGAFSLHNRSLWIPLSLLLRTRGTIDQRLFSTVPMVQLPNVKHFIHSLNEGAIVIVL